nr:tetratricopeptide repeat protein [uncultured Flavobacterium sp.]
MKKYLKKTVLFAFIGITTMVSNSLYAQSSLFDHSIEQLQADAAKNDVGSQSELGFNYKNGTGVDKDLKKAFYWLLKAAEQNDFGAMKEVATMYCVGNGTEVDYKKGFYWLKKADTEGNLRDPTVSIFLAIAYFNGQGTDKNYNKAFYHSQRAANMGSVEAMGQMVYFYQNGIGTLKDLEKAKYWEQKKKTGVNDVKEKEERFAGYEKRKIECDKILNDIKEEDERIGIEIEENKKSGEHIDYLQQSFDDSTKILKKEYGAYTDGKGVLVLKQINDISNPKYWDYRDVLANREQMRKNIAYAISNYNNRRKLNNDRIETNSKKLDDYNKDCNK